MPRLRGKACNVTRTGGARPKDARSAGLLSLDCESGRHPGWLLMRQGVSDAEENSFLRRVWARTFLCKSLISAKCELMSAPVKLSRTLNVER